MAVKPVHAQGYSVGMADDGQDLGSGVQSRWLRVYAPTKIFWCDLVGTS
jgi:hypothetical protein